MADDWIEVRLGQVPVLQRPQPADKSTPSSTHAIVGISRGRRGFSFRLGRVRLFWGRLRRTYSWQAGWRPGDLEAFNDAGFIGFV